MAGLEAGLAGRAAREYPPEAMRFRPLPILTLIAIPALAAMIWMGDFEVKRAYWKAGLIADYEKMAAAPAQSLSELLCGPTLAPADIIGRPVRAADVEMNLKSTAAKAEPVRMFGHSDKGDAGWRLLEAAAPPQCIAKEGALLVETGFETLNHTKTIYASSGDPPQRYTVQSWPNKSMFAPKNYVADDDWHWFDAPAIAKALGAQKLNADYYLTVVTGLPDEYVAMPPARHWGYAITWFGMAAAFVVIYAVFHARAGRLSFKKGAGSP